MPSRWRVTLPGADPDRVQPEHLHAVVSGWFDTGAEAHHAAAKPYTVSPPVRLDGGPSEGGVAFEVGLLVDDLASRLADVAAVGRRVRLGSTWSTIQRPPQQVAAVTWPDLAEAGAGTRQAWCLRFVTPTTFRRRNAFSPSPSPRAILGSLRRTWRDFAPTDLPPLLLELSPEPVWVTDVEVASQVVRVGGRTVSGFTGRMRFACDTGAEAAASVDRLVRLAPFAGVGAYTTRGFGMTCLEPAWRQPPPPPPADPR